MQLSRNAEKWQTNRKERRKLFEKVSKVMASGTDIKQGYILGKKTEIVIIIIINIIYFVKCHKYLGCSCQKATCPSSSVSFVSPATTNNYQVNLGKRTLCSGNVARCSGILCSSNDALKNMANYDERRNKWRNSGCWILKLWLKP